MVADPEVNPVTGVRNDRVKVKAVCVQNIQAEKEALTDGREKTPQYQRTEDGFIRVGE